MFDTKTYIERRKNLKKEIDSGIILFLGNEESAMNYPANPYPFRQDSSYLYFFGLDYPSMAAIIDIDENKDIVFGDDYTLDDIIWMGPQPSLKERASKFGVKEVYPLNKMEDYIKKAKQKGRKIHFIPPYRDEHKIKLSFLLDMKTTDIAEEISEELIKAIVKLREIKSSAEVEEIEKAVNITREMQVTAIKMAKPGIYERDLSGTIEGIARAKGSDISFPVILSIHGETLHNHYHGNLLEEGRMIVNDCGAESLTHYAGDITRTFPVSKKFTEKQKDIYQIVLNTQLKAIKAMKPGVKYRDIHVISAKEIAKGLNALGIMKGDIDRAVEEGAHALFYPHGLGHMMGMDVHDMENLGENYVGYNESIQRSEIFGYNALRLAKELKKGFVLTVEPGIYFIPELIDIWKKEGKFKEYIDYNKVEEYRHFGGIRIEDDCLITENGSRVLGKPIPKTIEEIEELRAGSY